MSKAIQFSDLHKWVSSEKECNFFYGGTTIILNNKDIEKLKSGMILNRGINCDEYGIAIKYQADYQQKFIEGTTDRV